MVWPCNEKRRHERCKASNNDEGEREETWRKAQTEVDGPSAERFETTLALSKTRTEPRSMEKGSHGDRPRTGIRSAKVMNKVQYMWCNIYCCAHSLQAHIGIKGFVVDADSLKAIPNAIIRVRGINKTVSAAGYGDYWRLLVPGIYIVSAGAPG